MSVRFTNGKSKIRNAKGKMESSASFCILRSAFDFARASGAGFCFVNSGFFAFEIDRFKFAFAMLAREVVQDNAVVR